MMRTVMSSVTTRSCDPQQAGIVVHSFCICRFFDMIMVANISILPDVSLSFHLTYTSDLYKDYLIIFPQIPT